MEAILTTSPQQSEVAERERLLTWGVRCMCGHHADSHGFARSTEATPCEVGLLDGDPVRCACGNFRPVLSPSELVSALSRLEAERDEWERNAVKRMWAHAAALTRSQELEAERDNLRPRESATHWEGCWQARGHHECAIARMLELEAENDKALDFISSRGYRRCDIPACNCGSWHGGHAMDRLDEIGRELEAHGISLNGRTLFGAIQALLSTTPTPSEEGSEHA